jgi:repressor LexA
MHPFASNIIQRREALGLNQAELAQIVGVSKATLSRWESGQLGPSRANLDALAAALRTTTSALHESAGESRALDAALLASALESLELALGKRFATLPVETRAKLIAFVYAKGGRVPESEAVALAELVA